VTVFSQEGAALRWLAGFALVLVGAWLLFDGKANRREPRPSERVPSTEVARESVAEERRKLEPVVVAREAVAAEGPVLAPVEQEPAEKNEEREEVPDPPTPAHPGPGEALLRVEITALETGAPLAGVELGIYPVDDDENDREWSFSTQSDPARGVEGDEVVTDAGGRGEFVLRASTPYRLRASGPNGLADEGWEEFAPLAEGEERTLRMGLATAWTFDWHGRVVDGETEQPLAGVEVVARTNSGDSIDESIELARGRTVGDGRIVLRLPAWQHAIVRCEAPGHFWGGSRVREEAASPDAAQTVTLRRPAGLAGTVLGSDGSAVPDIEVSVAAPAWQLIEGSYWDDVLWTGVSNADGRCAFPELPSAVELFVTLRRGERVLAWTHSSTDALRLEPGESHAVEWQLAGGARVTGRLVDHGGAPQAGVELVLRAAQLPITNPRLEPLYTGRLVRKESSDRNAPSVARTSTETDGSFAFEDVSAGGWMLEFDSKGFPELALPFVVHAGEELVELAPVVDRGLAIRGRVLDPEGAPVNGTSIWARGTGVELRFVGARGESRVDGSFTLEPVCAGTYLLETLPLDDPFVARSEPVACRAGDAAVELRLRWGGTLEVTSIDAASGEEVDSRVSVRPAREGAYETLGWEQQHLPAGHYEVVAWTKDTIGVLPDLLVGERSAATVDVLLAPGARVSFGDWSDPALDVHGLEVFAGALLRSTGDPLLVPAGPVRVRAWHERLDGTRETVLELEHTLAAGEEWVVTPP
jgi:hypothetical protein